MKLDRFINRPVLSTVISIVIVILGVIGLISMRFTQYPDIAPPTVRGLHVVRRRQRTNRA